MGGGEYGKKEGETPISKGDAPPPPTAMQAETAAKTAFILGRDKGLAWIEAHPSFACMMILDSGEVFISRSMQGILQGVKYAISK